MAEIKDVFKRWTVPLSELERGHHLNYVMNRLNLEYLGGTEIFPKRDRIFRAFNMLEPENLRVVILGMEPYATPNMATGYAFANAENTYKISPSLQKIKDTIERTTKNGLYLNFDVTLQHWAFQGVLALNSALTVEKNKPGSHIQVWRRFTEILISELSKNFDGISFCFWGKQAQSFAYLVDMYKHNVFTCYHPAYAVRQNIPWECEHFFRINKYLSPEIEW